MAAAKGGNAQDARQGAARPGASMPPAETAQYIAEFTAELAFLARRADLDVLAYLLDMARLEATQNAETG
jgi:hypothetical protein